MVIGWVVAGEAVSVSASAAAAPQTVRRTWYRTKSVSKRVWYKSKRGTRKTVHKTKRGTKATVSRTKKVVD
jgi:hypothetical protein